MGRGRRRACGRAGYGALVVLAGCVACLVGAPAAAAQRIDPSVQRWVLGRYAEARGVAHALPAGIAAIERLPGELAGRCPGVLAAAPAGPQRSALEWEAFAVVGLDLIAPAEQPVRGFAEAMLRLRWPSRRLAGLVRALAETQLAVTRMSPPDLCADAAVWVRSGYRTLAPASARAARVFRAGDREGALERQVGRALGRLATPSEKRLLQRAASATAGAALSGLFESSARGVLQAVGLATAAEAPLAGPEAAG